jgi:adenylate cyclase class IV
MVADQKIEDGIRRVLEKIPAMSKPLNVDLNYDPVTLRQKIEADNVMLYFRAQAQVNIYFNAVHEKFQELSQEGRLRFNPFCNQVKITYLNLKDKDYGQERIFNEMVD